MKDYQNRFPGWRLPASFARAALFLVAALTLAASCQNPPSKPDTAESPIRVNVNVVNVLFNVKDKRGALIPGLKKEDFDLYEDGAPQTIKYFAAESELPLTLGLLVDTSGSQERVLSLEKDAGAEFLKDVIGSKDMAFLIDFSTDVQLDQDFTGSVKYLKKSLDELRINTGGHAVSLPPGAGGDPIPQRGIPRGTLLYDAVYLASFDKLKSEVGRKALILLTDGQDQGSRTRPREAIEAALKADAIVYVILIADRGFYGGSYFGEGEMKKLTQETGGRVIDVGNDYRKLKEAFDQISLELRHQYYIGYTPTNTSHDGGYRKIEVRPKGKDLNVKDAKVQARKGYYAPKE